MHKVLSFVAIIALLFISAARADDSDVLVLTDANFAETLDSNEHVFAEFYAPWCGHCKNLAPDWAKLATQMKDDGVKVVIGKLDATVETKTAGAQKVSSYPTLIFFKNGQPIKYEGDRSLAALTNFVNKKTGPASLEVKSAEQLEKLKASGAVVAYIVGNEESDEYKNWMRAATSGQLEEFTLAHVFDAAVRGDKTGVYIYKPKEDPIKFPDATITKTKLVQFVQLEGYPLVEEIAQPVWQRSQNQNKPFLAVFAEASDLPLVQEIAKKYKGKYIVTHAPLPAQKQLAERWGASGKVFPTAVFADWKGMTSPFMTVFNEETEKFNFETAVNFVEKSIAGTYDQYLKSEPIPTDQTGPTVTLVGKNFNTIVNNAEKDVFVEFYAPWCGHCKKLAPIWDELAEKFKADSHIVIAKIDATANTLPKSVNVRGYPTLIFFPANNKAGVTFSGERDLPSLAKFVQEQSTKPLKAAKEDL